MQSAVAAPQAATSVMYEGTVIDVAQTMQLLERLRQQLQEQDKLQLAQSAELSELLLTQEITNNSILCNDGITTYPLSQNQSRRCASNC